jgi:hypothetical protein
MADRVIADELRIATGVALIDAGVFWTSRKLTCLVCLSAIVVRSGRG